MRSMICVLAFSLGLGLSGCDSAPGRPALGSQVLPPNQVLNFEHLYRQNCTGCHGSADSSGAAVSLNGEVYLTIADDATIRRVTTEGVPGTPMPAFGQSSGGMLTQEQINAIVTGIRARRAKPTALEISPPPYAAATLGDPKRGAEVYRTYCFSCHGEAGYGGSKAGSIVDRSYLALVSDQYLRTIVIAGRPEIGAPDWRGNIPGKPMSQQDVSDVVAWLSAQRPKILTRAYSNANADTEGAQ